MKKTLIAVVPLVDEQRESYWMLPGYFKGIEEVGGIPLMLPLTDDSRTIERIMEVCGGILFTGGQDVNPALYGEERLAACGSICQQRDDAERALLTAALAHDKAVLGICRGIQFMCAALGGSLYQDLPTQHPSDINHCQKPPYDVPVHTVNILSESPLYKLLGKERLKVNSYHHQAVKRLPSSLVPMAYATDGICEAVCMPNKKFVWAVQWHPEFSYQKDPDSKKIFSAFVAAAQI